MQSVLPRISHPKGWRGLHQSFGVILLSVPWLWYSVSFFQRPPRTNWQQPLAPGVIYHRGVRASPRHLVLHWVMIDLNTSGLEVQVTPPDPQHQEWTQARTTSEFIHRVRKASQVTIAINGNFFRPFREKLPWDYFPKSGDRVAVFGQGISKGQRYGTPSPIWSSLCVQTLRQIQMLPGEACPAGTLHGIAGRAILLKDGQSQLLEALPGDMPYPRTAVGLSHNRSRLWLLVVDGKQPSYSEGVTAPELIAISQELGISTLLELDGGGSATLVVASPQGTQVLNSPIHTKLPLHQRPVANHLGISVPIHSAESLP